MPLSDYSSVGGGGGLKLKGVKDGRVKKSKKKDKQVLKNGESTSATEDNDAGMTKTQDSQQDDIPRANKYGKTQAQIEFEERRRKTLEEKVQKEGIKTHKEKVEQLNKYLSKLSEHHDMPRIGPG